MEANTIDLWKGNIYSEDGIYTCPTGQAGMIILLRLGYASNGEDYKYSSARFYKTGVDDFRFLTHWMK